MSYFMYPSIIGAYCTVFYCNGVCGSENSEGGCCNVSYYFLISAFLPAKVT